MTQEREAMERLVVIRQESHTENPTSWQHLYNTSEAIEAAGKIEEDEETVIDAALSRHARSLQPITVEGLVAMGAELVEGLSYQTKYLLKGIRIFVSVHGDMEWYYAEPYQSHLLQVCPAPENMLHVDELVERVGS